ncbi:MAG: manganese efflux pump MntP [Planctomycetota bacterium]|jgi:putative Mn2+ efflux pump MntP
MDIVKLIAVAVGLGADAMSVCMAVGVRRHGPGEKFRLAASMGLFQFAMPLIGWVIGDQLASLLTTWGCYLAAGCVMLVGVKMLTEAWRSHPGATAEAIEHEVEKDLHLKAADPTRGWPLILLAVATSLDALVVGFSLGLKQATSAILGTSVVIGLVAAGMALAGVAIGRRLGTVMGRPAEFLGGIVLIALGISFLCL